MLGDAVVEHALAVDRTLLLGVEGGGVVLEILDQRARLRALVEDLGLAFVDLAASCHRVRAPWAWPMKKVRPERGIHRTGARGRGGWAAAIGESRRPRNRCGERVDLPGGERFHSARWNIKLLPSDENRLHNYDDR